MQPVTVIGAWTGFQTSDDTAAASNATTTGLISVLDSVEFPIVVVHRDLTVAGFNRAAADVLSMSLSHVGAAVRATTLFQRWPRLEQECWEVIANGMESRIDVRGEDKSFDLRISPYASGDREVTGTVLMFHDVTAFDASMNQAIYERECTKVILNTVAEPLVVLSADHQIQSGNRAFYTMFGVSREGTQSLSFYELADGALAHPPLQRQLQESLADIGHPFESVEVDHVITAKGERSLSLDVRPLSFPGHPQRRILVTFQDITARKQAEAAKDQRSEEELRRSETFLAEGQRLSVIGSFAWKVATDETTWSEQLHRIYELEIGTPVTPELIRTRVHPEDLSFLEGMVEKAREGVPDFEWQYRLIMPDGSVKFLQAVAHATRDWDGQLEYIAAVQDVTARRMSEEALAKARSELAKVARVTSLGVLTASIAHEVNQPLAGIITNASTCLRMLDTDPPNVDGARETARRTIRDGTRASDVITRLRALFSNDALTLEFLDMNEVTREVIALAMSDLQRNRVALESEFAEDVPIVRGDRIQLQQVILNLLRNAMDAMDEVQDRPRYLLLRTVCEDGDRVRVSVRDAGVGVDAQNVNKLLDAFYTTKSDGMGIGLSVSRSIIERHRGHLWAEPNDGPGATFSFSIPIDPEMVTEAAL
jgi:PAS domain S-box-containing protein